MLNFDNFEVLTFDCYGTLIDWESGIGEALHPVLASRNINLTIDDLLELFAALESEIQSGTYFDYKTILAMVLDRLGKKLEFVPTQAELMNFSESVKAWPAFPDSASALQELKKKYKLAIISNIDDDLFASSAQRLQIEFDWVITAQQAKSYKPSFNNFYMALERIARPHPKLLHVAQSLFHDIVPAKALGLATVWVNRRYEKEGYGATPPAQAQPDLEVWNLQELVEKIGLI